MIFGTCRPFSTIFSSGRFAIWPVLRVKWLVFVASCLSWEASFNTPLTLPCAFARAFSDPSASHLDPRLSPSGICLSLLVQAARLTPAIFTSPFFDFCFFGCCFGCFQNCCICLQQFATLIFRQNSQRLARQTCLHLFMLATVSLLEASDPEGT